MENFLIKHRPTCFRDYIGNASVVASLEKAIKRHHVFLLCGEKGVGKTTLALTIANELGVRKEDIYLYNAANTRGIDTTRSIEENVKYKPFGKLKFYILDESHQLTSQASECLLKPTENPPDYAYFIFCTTMPENILPTLRDRCTEYEIKPLFIRETKKLVRIILSKEKKEFDNEIVLSIAEKSKGVPRKALKLLMKVIDLEDKDLILDIIDKEDVCEGEMIDICRLIMGTSPSIERWEKARKILKDMKISNVDTVRMMVLNYFGSIMLNKRNPEFFMYVIDEFADSFQGGKASLYYAICNTIFKGK